MVRSFAFRMPYIPGVVLGSWLMAGLLCCAATAQAQIFRYQGPDGRLYFTNLPPSPAARPTVVMRPALAAARLVAQAPVLPLVHRVAQQYSLSLIHI